MLDHFHVEDDVERLAICRQLLGGRGAIVDGDAGCMACAAAIFTFRSDASAPSTLNPNRAIGSDSSPPTAADIQQR